MRLFWFALKQCLNAFQTLAPARLATPAAGPFLPQNGRKNFASPHCASLQNFAFILVQSPLKIALSCPFSPFPAFLHSSVPPRQHFITLHENSHWMFLVGCGFRCSATLRSGSRSAPPCGASLVLMAYCRYVFFWRPKGNRKGLCCFR